MKEKRETFPLPDAEETIIKKANYCSYGEGNVTCRVRLEATDPFAG